MCVAGVNVWLYVDPSYPGRLPLPCNCLCKGSARQTSPHLSCVVSMSVMFPVSISACWPTIFACMPNMFHPALRTLLLVAQELLLKLAGLQMPSTALFL